MEERRRPLSDVEEEAGSVVVVLLLLLGRLLVLDDELESDLVTLPLRETPAGRDERVCFDFVF